MKLLALVPLLAWVLTACSNGSDSDEDYYLSVGNGVVFDVNGGEEYLSISSRNHTWTITNDASWLRLSSLSGTGESLKLTATANNLQEDRSTILTVKVGNLTETATVTQKGRSSLIAFNDPRFQDALVAMTWGTWNMGNESFHYNKVDLDSDGQISEIEASKARVIRAGGSNASKIRNMDEIGYFTGVTHLICGNNEFASLGVSKNKALKYLDCNINQLTVLDVSKNTGLATLNCENNQLTTLDVSKNIALTTLNCGNYMDTGNNVFTSLDLSNNIKLTSLNCRKNKLTSLNLSANTALITLNCQTNNLSSLDVSKNTELTALDCSGNKLTALDVSKNPKLTSLSCYSNNLTSLDLSKNRKLTSLSCSGNQLETLILYRYHIIESNDIANIKSQYPNLTITYAD